jgi:nucleotide-binding universal stress UspA family protein
MRRRILVPVTTSKMSKRGLDYALENYPDAELTALHVFSSGSGDVASMGSGDPSPFHQALSEDDGTVERGDLASIGPSDTDMFGDDEEPSDTGEKAAAEFLAAVKAYAERHGVDIDTALMRGQPSRAIVKRAEDGAFDLIIIGSHGRDSVADIILGSTAEKVVERSPASVLVVR